MIELLDDYDVALLVAGLAAFGVVVLPRILADRPLSYPIIYLAAGVVFFSLPLGFHPPDPIMWSDATERLTEFGVIMALMGAGIGLSKPLRSPMWHPTWRLLGVTMPLSIAVVALLGWWALGLAPAVALLFGAVLAPTDPVLASDVQVHGPDAEQDDVRFALTSEAGLNDGLAFPFVTLALLVAVEGSSPSVWWTEFVFVEVGYKVSVGLVAGAVVGRLLAFVIFDRRSPLPQTRDGLVALAATLIAFAVTELVGGYGFLAVFVAALMIRRSEGRHEYHGDMHGFVDQIDRMVTAVILILFGGAIASGLLGGLRWVDLGVALLILFVARPVTALLAMTGLPLARRDRTAIAFFGIRGIGSFYYLAHASNQVQFGVLDRLWAVVGLVVVLSTVVHGVTATPVMRYLDRRRARSDRPTDRGPGGD